MICIVLKVLKNRTKVVEIDGEKVDLESLPEKSTPAIRTTNDFQPTIEKIREYFLEQNSNEVEAQKFFNHFQSNGWMVGGKAPMKDWHAAAGNWILNIPKFTPQPQIPILKQPIPGNLNVSTGKNYSEPL